MFSCIITHTSWNHLSFLPFSKYLVVKITPHPFLYSPAFAPASIVLCQTPGVINFEYTCRYTHTQTHHLYLLCHHLSLDLRFFRFMSRKQNYFIEIERDEAEGAFLLKSSVIVCVWGVCKRVCVSV